MQQLRRHKGRRAKAEINVVPYIDVMLVLLVIFMVAAPLVNPGVVNLPTVGAAAMQQLPPMVVTLGADMKLAVRVNSQTESFEQTVPCDKLTELVRKRKQAMPDQPVVIAADKSVKYEAVMDIMAELKDGGVRRVGLMVKSK
ncbi:MAG: protein TolR [Candidatus Protistobacter heckmanni]|nr:protein TolR [Candidatus Protistobacter heckmanni]